MNRRDFIKTALKTALASGIYPVISYATAKELAPKEKGIKRYVTGCMWCQNGCSMIVYIKDGKVVHLTGNPDDPVTKGRICIKPFGSLELINSPYRLTHPLKLIGPRGPGAQFVKIGWGQALDEIAERLIHIRRRYGGEALGIWASGRSASDGRKLNKAFARLYGTRNYEKTGPFCNCSGKIAGVSVLGTGHTPWTYRDDDFYNADLYIFIGSNFAITRPVSFSVLESKRSQHKFRSIVIDPRCSETARKADLWLAIRPGTDLALALGLMHYIISHDLIDSRFIARHTKGFDRLKSEILKGNYDLAWASRTTGLNKKDIESLARLYAHTKKAIVIGNAGLSHHTNAVQTHRAFYFLAAITGHFGGKSIGYSCLNNGGISTGSLDLPIKKVPRAKMELSKNPVGWFESIEGHGYPYRLRALIATGSPLTQWPDQSRIRRSMDRLELSVYNGLTKNINAYYFDYILPAATWIEAGGLAPVSDDSRSVWVPRLIDPPGLARPDRWWWIELGKRMGWGDIFLDRFKDPVVLQDTAGGPKGYEVKYFTAKKDNSLTAPVKIVDGKVKERGTLFLDGQFPTKSKKIELWSKDLEREFASYGLTAIPRFYTDPDIASVACDETICYDRSRLIPSVFQRDKTYTFKVSIATKKEPERKFPFYLITGRPSEAIMGHTSHWIKKLNDLSPDQFCSLHIEVARRLGIKDGEHIEICSPYGKTWAKAILTSHIRKDTIFIPYSYGEKAPFTPWKSVNFLINMAARCPISGEVAFKGTMVSIKKHNKRR